MNVFVGFIGIGLILIMLAIGILFLITQQNTLESIAPESRFITPGNVWLQLIPLFNFYWYFVVVNKLSQSIALEYSRLNIGSNERYPTKNMGIVTGVIYFFTLIPSAGIKGFASLGWLICLIIYWVQIFNCRKKIIANRGNDLLDIERELLKKSGM